MTSQTDVVIGGAALPVDLFGALLTTITRTYPNATVTGLPTGGFGITLGQPLDLEDQEDDDV